MRDTVIKLMGQIEDVRPRLKRQALESHDSTRVGNVVLIDFLSRLYGMLDNLERNPAAWRAIESQDATAAHVVGVLNGSHGPPGLVDDGMQIVHGSTDIRENHAA